MPACARLFTWLFLSLGLFACAYETVRLPIDKRDVSYRVVEIDRNYQPQPQTHAAQAPAVSALHAADQPADATYDYILGPGDVLSFTLSVIDPSGETGMKRIIPQAPALESETEYLVSASGHISLPYAGRIKVGGLRFEEAREHIHALLQNYFVHPQMELKVRQFASGFMTVSGEVQRPGEVSLRHEPLHLLKALNEAGGALPTADLANATLTRADGTAMPMDIAALLFDGKEKYNVVMQAGDMLHIPRNHGNRIFITGEVLSPRTLTMHGRGMSLTEALTETGGLNPITAKPSNVYVLRSTPAPAPGEPDIIAYHLDATDPQGYVYADTFRMQPRDVVYVGTQAVTEWNRFLMQFLPISVTALANNSNLGN